VVGKAVTDFIDSLSDLHRFVGTCSDRLHPDLLTSDPKAIKTEVYKSHHGFNPSATDRYPVYEKEFDDQELASQYEQVISAVKVSLSLLESYGIREDAKSMASV
jgi:hypothetical protein